MRIATFLIALVANLFLGLSGSHFAFAAPPPERPRLTNEAAQSIAPLFNITLRDVFIASRWNRPGTSNFVEFRPSIPFKVWDQLNLLRITVPFRTHSELGPGLSDVQVFDLLGFKTDWGLWGLGPLVNLRVYRGPETDTVQTGPVFSVLLTSMRNWSFGLLNQNLFSSSISLSTFQPIAVYQFAPGWTIGLGELPITYNWKKGEFTLVSLGFQLGYLARIAQQPLRFFVNPQFNTQSSTQLYRWTIASGISFILPAPQNHTTQNPM